MKRLISVLLALLLALSLCAHGEQSRDADDFLTWLDDSIFEDMEKDWEELANKLMSEFVFEHFDRIPAEEGGDLYLINGNMLPLAKAGAFADTNDNGEEENPDEGSDEEVLGVEESGGRKRLSRT